MPGQTQRTAAFQADLQTMLQDHMADARTQVEPQGAGFWVVREGCEFFVQAAFQRELPREA